MSKLKSPSKYFKGEYPGAVARSVGAPRPHLAAPGRGSVLGGAARPPPARQPPAAGAAAARHSGQVSGDWSRVRVFGSHWSSCPRVRVLGCDWPVSTVQGVAGLQDRLRGERQGGARSQAQGGDRDQL